MGLTKYENPLQKTPCIKALVAIACGCKRTEELLELGVTNSRSALYEVLDSLQAGQFITKDPDVKPMPTLPNREHLLGLLKLRQAHHGLVLLLVPVFSKQVRLRLLRLRNRNNVAEAVQAMKEIAASVSAADEEKLAVEIAANTPEPVEFLMSAFLDSMLKVGKPKRRQLLAVVSLAPLAHFSEFFDIFFSRLVLDGDGLARAFRGERRKVFEGYLRVLRAGWNRNQGFVALVERNPELSKFYEPLKRVGL